MKRFLINAASFLLGLFLLAVVVRCSIPEAQAQTRIARHGHHVTKPVAAPVTK